MSYRSFTRRGNTENCCSPYQRKDLMPLSFRHKPQMSSAVIYNAQPAQGTLALMISTCWSFGKGVWEKFEATQFIWMSQTAALVMAPVGPVPWSAVLLHTCKVKSRTHVGEFHLVSPLNPKQAHTCLMHTWPAWAKSACLKLSSLQDSIYLHATIYMLQHTWHHCCFRFQ